VLVDVACSKVEKQQQRVRDKEQKKQQRMQEREQKKQGPSHDLSPLH
jgi:hypothetical protein